MTRIECACHICKKNAKALGLPFPLAAMVRDDVLAKVGTGSVHGLVYTINDPFIRRAIAMGKAVAIGEPIDA